MTRLSLLTFMLCLAATPTFADEAKDILQATGIKGGFVVHLGCGDGKLTAALHANDSYLVQGLDSDPQNVAAARRNIQSLGLYGKVTVDQLRGARLPYIENFVNLVVADKPDGVAMEEVMRVLAPNGVAYIGGQKTVKPRPKDIDEWTHYLHDPSNNAVAHDSEVGPLARMQWIAAPFYSRHHDHMSGASAMVSANGRNFYIFEDAPRASILIPPQWHLYARDAFNGTLLWERTIARWHEYLWPLKSGPQLLTRRLVAVGDRVYVTLNIDGPLLALNAATGKTIRTYNETKTTEEILCDNGTLFLVVAGPGQPLRSDPKKVYTTFAEIRADVTNPLWTKAPRTVMAVDADSGRVLWKKDATVVSESLAADAQHVLFHDGEKIQCLDRHTGNVVWASAPVAVRERMRSSGGATLVLHDGVVLFSGQVADAKGRQRTTRMSALSAADGKLLWQAEHPPCGHMGTPDDILVLGDTVWCGAVAQPSDSGIMTGRDIRTGKIVKEFSPDVETHWFHHRCYRAKATDKYLLFSRTGIEFIDVALNHWICHHWVRGACLYGVMPANGMIYNPPHPCACYLDAKLFGFNALAPASKTWQPSRNVPEEGRLERGPAYDPNHVPRFTSHESDWPTYRGDAARSGSSATTVPAELKRAWQTELGGKLSPPVIAGGKLFVAAVDAGTVHALDAGTGKLVWSFTAGGRVDSPPTIWHDRVLFGSADGCVYCLRADDGALAWRFRAAPEDRRHFAFEQIESVWPVHGSVLVQNDTVYCVAGRSMFLDGGLRMLRLNPASGEKISETITDDRDPKTGANLQSDIKNLNMPVALPDILSSDGRYVYMRSLPFTLDGQRKFVSYVPVQEQKGDDTHLFSETGFLDDTMWHRTYWEYGRAFASGAGGYYLAGRLVPAGRLLVFHDDTVFGYGRLWQYYRWTTPMEFHLFAAAKHPAVVKAGEEARKARAKKSRVGTKPVKRFSCEWSDNLAVQVNAMVLTGQTLFVAGPPDVVDEDQAAKSPHAPDTERKLAEQEAAFEGQRGALLVAVSAKDGKKLAAYRLDSMPVFDGLAAANGRLYLTTADGKILCLAPDEGAPLATPAEVLLTPRTAQADRIAAPLTGSRAGVPLISTPTIARQYELKSLPLQPSACS